jgi:hypothetical protein
MARSVITATGGGQLQNDSGSILWSIIQGEQLEFTVTLGFLTDISNYVFEAAVMEALNTPDGAAPILAKPLGIQTKLPIVVPNPRGIWLASNAYSTDDFVYDAQGLTYKKITGTSVVSSILPSLDASWVRYTNNQIKIRFPGTLGTTWTLQPSPTTDTYGFFELSVGEPVSLAYPKTWKPMRGMVELQFSPTLLVV